MTKTVSQERRNASRLSMPRGLGVQLLQPQVTGSMEGLNFSQGGLCLRLQEAIDVRSLVRLQLTAGGRVMRNGIARGTSPVEFTGRVSWVMQRLDLRASAPFLYDVGIEFVDPPPLLRRLLARTGAGLTAPKARSARGKRLDTPVFRGRRFVPELTREPQQPPRWHLVVSVDGVPCFSGHYASEREALAYWVKFKQGRGRR